MAFWKAINNNETIDVGSCFMKWVSSNNIFAYCDVNDAQFAQSSLDENRFYHCCWLKPEGAVVGFIEVDELELIDETEYDELYALLSDGEPVPQPAPTPEPEPEPEPEPVDEHPMTIQEMRDRISVLSDLIYGSDQPIQAPQNYAENEVFNVGLKFYQATTVIVKGETITPGGNCREISIADLLNSINSK